MFVAVSVRVRYGALCAVLAVELSVGKPQTVACSAYNCARKPKTACEKTGMDALPYLYRWQFPVHWEV